MTHTTLLEHALSHFNPYLSLKLCTALRAVLTRQELFQAVNKSSLFWIANRILKYLLNRLDFLDKYCRGEMEEDFEDFEGARLHIAETINVLAELGEAHKVGIAFHSKKVGSVDANV